MATQPRTIDATDRPRLRTLLLASAALALCGAEAHAQDAVATPPAATTGAPAAVQSAQPSPAAPATAPAAAPAQAAMPHPDDIDEDTEVEALVIEAQRTMRGSVIGDIQPEISLSPRDIRSYGVSTVDDLINALAPQLSSGQGRDASGRPVILVNGARTSSFREVRDIPVEAILRTDILPEEVSLKYGYAAGQRVVNLILRPRFRARTIEGGYETSTDGGGDVGDLRASLFTVQRQSRVLLDAKATGQAALMETDRDLIQPRTDAAFRTLVPEQSSLELNAVVSRPLGAGISGTLNGSLESTQGNSKLGLNSLTGGALKRDSESVTGHLGAAAAGAIKGWSWTATTNADRVESDNKTERVVAGVAYRDRSNSVSTSADGEVMMNGPVFRAPAGQVNASVTGGFSTLKYETDATRAGVASSGDLSRDTGSLKANIDIPIASTRSGVLDRLGNLSINFNAAYEDVSDFGGLSTLGYGANWTPISKLRLLATFTRDEGAPTVQQLGAPVQVTPGVQAYDFRTGQTVVINRIEGGSTDLSSDTRDVIKLGLNLKPFEKTDLTITADYVKTRTNDLISSFPTSSSQIEDAFPERFTRNAAGQLTAIDARPVNFERRDSEQLKYGFTYRRPIGPVFTPGQRGQRPAGQGGQAAGQRRAQQDDAAAPGQGAPGQSGQAQGGQAQGAPAPGGEAPPPGQGFGPPPGAGPGGGGFGGAPGGGFGGARGGGGFGGPPGGGGGNLQLGIYHTIKFQDEVLIRSGLPVLDLLDGGSIGSGGGTPRNQLDVQANLSKNGLGASLFARWTEGTTVRASGVTGRQDLNFADLTTVNLRLFAELRQQPYFRDHPFFRGSRASLTIDNIFNQKQDVRTPDGLTPATYQNDYLDPQGRTIRVSFRKLF